MFYHLKVAFRNLRRNGMYSTISVSGLAIALAAVILIMLWVGDELSFNRFHKRSKDMYQANIQFQTEGKDAYWPIASAPMAYAAKEEIPDVEDVCRVFIWGRKPDFLKNGERVITDMRYAMVDSSFFTFFDFPLLKGNARRALVDPYSIVLSSSMAKKLFGNEDPIGQIVLDQEQQQYHVTGVMADMPGNSSHRFDVLSPFTLNEIYESDAKTEWRRFNFHTYLLLRPGADAQAIAKKLTEIQMQNQSEVNVSYILQPLEDINLYEASGAANSKMQACRLLSVAAFILLLIACVNYVNLVTARATRRDKEIFTRSLLGAKKKSLFASFFSESLLLFFLSLIVAIALLLLVFPAYNLLIGKQLSFHIFSGTAMAMYGSIFLIMMLAAGIYPAISLSLRSPLQGIRSTNVSKMIVRRTLVVVQFVAAVVLIMGALVMNRQLRYIQLKSPGYERENVFYVNLSDQMKKKKDVIQSELSLAKGVEGVTFVSQSLTNVTSSSMADWEGMEDEKVLFVNLLTDEHFIPTMGVKILEGENFSGTDADGNKFILNKTAVQAADIQDPIGKSFKMNGVDGIIVGVTEDFHFQDMHTAIKPLVIMSNKWWISGIYVKTSGTDIPQAIAATKKIWEQYNPNIPFSYYFLDEEFDTVYKSDLQTSNLFECFAFIAIFVSCLGLFGLATYTVEAKTKEIAIRKVLGASVSGIVERLSREFLVLIGVAILVAFPLAYYWLNRMLEDYAYRIGIAWWMFVAVGITIVVFTLLTVGYQAVKAATANPVKSLKTE